MRIGTPLQAIKWTRECRTCRATPSHAAEFLALWLSGNPSISECIGWHHVKGETMLGAVDQITFARFCELNPDEPERSDGRKLHYGQGKQPVDTIRELGWAPEFFAGNVLKYLRRDKAREHSVQSARVYYGWLQELAHAKNVDDAGYRVRDVLFRLDGELSEEELQLITKEKE